MITFRGCDSHQGSVKDVRKVCQLIERCYAHGRSVRELNLIVECLMLEPSEKQSIGLILYPPG